MKRFGENISDTLKIMVLILGMPESFRAVNKFLLVGLEKLTFARACDVVRQSLIQDRLDADQRQVPAAAPVDKKKVTNGTSDAKETETETATDGASKHSDMKCFRCHGYGHSIKNCTSPKDIVVESDDQGPPSGGHAKAAYTQSDLDLLNENGRVLEE